LDYYIKVEQKNGDGHEVLIHYWVEEVERENTWFTVIGHDTHEMIDCCYMNLELMGFSCRHIFVIMKYTNMKQIPNGCILDDKLCEGTNCATRSCNRKG